MTQTRAGGKPQPPKLRNAHDRRGGSSGLTVARAQIVLHTERPPGRNDGTAQTTTAQHDSCLMLRDKPWHEAVTAQYQIANRNQDQGPPPMHSAEPFSIAMTAPLLRNRSEVTEHTHLPGLAGGNTKECLLIAKRNESLEPECRSPAGPAPDLCDPRLLAQEVVQSLWYPNHTTGVAVGGGES